MEARKKSRVVREQLRASAMQKKNDFHMKKREEARKEVYGQTEMLKSKIKSYESETVDLERQEAELLARLQQTQTMERDAFGKLENAMVDASIPKHLRV